MSKWSTYLTVIKKVLKQLDRKLLDELYPNDSCCLFCNTRWPSERFYLCKACERGLIDLSEDQKVLGFPLARPDAIRNLSAFRHSPFEALYAKYSYSPFAKRLLIAYKKHRRAYLSFTFSKMLIELIDEKIDIEQIDALCYIPSTQAKIRYRGFDNMKLIAEKVAEHYDIELVDILGIRKTGSEQKRLSQDRRYKNISQAFFLKYLLKKEEKGPIRLLLVDDVITTGATMESAADVLRRAGIEVYGVSIFRSIRS